MSEKTTWYVIAHPTAVDRVILRTDVDLGFLVYPRDADALAARLNALTSERDEAVRVADHWKEDALRDQGQWPIWMRELQQSLAEAVRVAGELRKHLGFVLAMTRYEDHSNGVVYQGMDEGDVVSGRIIADADEVAARYDALTQGGDLPLKEQE